MAFRTFLASRNIEFNLRRYGIDALNFMALGLFSSLIIGLILKTVGGWLDWPWLIEVGKQAQGAMGAAIGVGVAYALKAPPLVLFASVATGTAGAAVGGGFAAVFDGYFGVGHHGYFADAAGFQRGGGDCPVAQRLGGRGGHSRLLRPNGRLRGHEFPR